LKKLLEYFDNLDNGKSSDLEEMELLSKYIAANARCGLGQMAPTAFQSALKNFRSEFEGAVKGGESTWKK
jgi:NADH:ubiquinone oxidoreductase subunit F (NADH-binding)